MPLTFDQQASALDPFDTVALSAPQENDNTPATNEQLLVQFASMLESLDPVKIDAFLAELTIAQLREECATTSQVLLKILFLYDQLKREQENRAKDMQQLVNINTELLKAYFQMQPDPQLRNNPGPASQHPKAKHHFTPS